MNLQDTWDVPPLDDEVFSSWIDRTMLKARWTEKRALFENLVYQQTGESYFDPDYDIGGHDFRQCCHLASIDAEWASTKFPMSADFVIPRVIRRAYCIKCMEESIAECGFPIYKRSWGLVLMPYCCRHQVLLEQGEFSSANTINLGLKLFKRHWARQNHKTADRLVKLYPWGKLSLQVQAAIGSDLKLRCSLVVKILAQLFLSSWFLFVFAENRRDSRIRKGGLYETVRPSVRAMLHRDCISASAAMRAKALCYIGRVLGLLSDADLESAFHDELFLPRNLASLISYFQRAGNLDVAIIVARQLFILLDDETPKDTGFFVRGLLDGL